MRCRKMDATYQKSPNATMLTTSNFATVQFHSIIVLLAPIRALFLCGALIKNIMIQQATCLSSHYSQAQHHDTTQSRSRNAPKSPKANETLRKVRIHGLRKCIQAFIVQHKTRTSGNFMFFKTL